MLQNAKHVKICNIGIKDKKNGLWLYDIRCANEIKPRASGLHKIDQIILV